MLDTAAIIMSQGRKITYGYAEGVNDNMSNSHFHDFFELYYLESGERHHMINGELYDLSSQNCVIFPPNIMHHSFGDKDVAFKRIVIYFTPDMILSPAIRSHLEGEAHFFSLKNCKRSMINLLMSMINTEVDNDGLFQEEYLKTLLNHLILTLLRASYTPIKSIPKTRTSQAVTYIHEHYAEDISVAGLAELLYISPYHLCREFKRMTGKTIIQYVNLTRVLHAQRMLLETDHNITRISRDTGFSNLTHFNRIFKGITGMSPSQKRNQYRKEKETLED